MGFLIAVANPNDPNERRAEQRIAPHPDDHVIINNVRYQLKNWSVAGLLFGPMGNLPEVGQKLEMKVVVLLRNDRYRFEAVGEVMRILKNDVAVKYECKTPEAAQTIKTYFSKK